MSACHAQSARRIAASVMAIACASAGRAMAQEWHSGVTASSSMEVVSNPYLDETSTKTTAAATLEIRPALWYNGSGTKARIDGYIRGRQFFTQYGLEDDYGINAKIDRRVDERTTLTGFAGIDYTKGRLGELPQSAPTQVGATPIPLPAFGQVPTEDVTLIGLRGRTTSYRTGLSAFHQFNDRNQLELSASFQSINFDSPRARDYTIYDIQGRYSTIISERTSVGVAGGWQTSNYSGTRIGDGRVGTLMATVNHKFNDRWTLGASAGAAFISTQDALPGSKITSTTLSFDATLCNRDQRGSVCLAYSRRPQPTALGGLINSDAFNLTFNRRVDETNAVTVSGAYARSNPSAGILGSLPKIQYASANVRLDHRFNQRLSGFIGTSWAHTYRSDLRLRSSASASVGINIRLGNLT